MSNKIQKISSDNLAESDEIIKKAKDIILSSIKSCPSDPDNIVVNMINKGMIPKIISRESLSPEEIKIATQFSVAHSLKTGHALIDSVFERYRGLAIQMKSELETEFDCKKPSEKALVDQSVNCYIRKLAFSARLQDGQNFQNFSKERNGYFDFLSREIDRAHRQFLSSLEMLRLMKQPAMKVNVKTQNAFIADKQQFNNNVENNESK